MSMERLTGGQVLKIDRQNAHFKGMKKKKERNDYWLVMAVIMAIFMPISYYYCGLAGAITPVAGAAIYGYLYYRGL